MNPTLERELARCEPHIPFRSATGYHHHTWARTYHSYPELFLQPQSTEEIQKIVTLARRCRRRLVTCGAAHSPSDLTCTSAWLVNLDRYAHVLRVDAATKRATVQAGARLRDLITALKEHGLALPTLGSIVDQSLAGAIGTGTHGSGVRKGLLSDYIESFRIVLANGRIVACSEQNNVELFRAGLVSLGALGIIVELTIKAVPDFNLRWTQSLVSQATLIDNWDKGFWEAAEYERVWLFPYMKQCVRWQAHKTQESIKKPKISWTSGLAGHHIYSALLWIAHYIPRILPWMEKFVIAVQYGGPEVSGVEDGMTALQMDCLFSQFVNEWAIPLERGPEALQRLSDWLHGDQEKSRIPFDPKGVWVHAPLEVRIGQKSTRPYLANSYEQDSLMLNATLYRPAGLDPPCRKRYYEAFEWLMKELGGRPHWAKNFCTVSGSEIHGMYPAMDKWLQVRHEVDPDGMFLGDWHRRCLLADEKRTEPYPLEEQLVKEEFHRGGGILWTGKNSVRPLTTQNSEESFDLMHAAETKSSMLLDLSASSSSEQSSQAQPSQEAYNER